MSGEGSHDEIRTVATPENNTFGRKLLQSTIYSKDKESRVPAFEEAWKQRWNTPNHKPAYFQTEEGESPFSQYSSRGWKIHIAFQKGKEKAIAKFLFTNGLYFKVEGQIGTYFYGNKTSGATIYIGSYDNMIEIANIIGQEGESMLTEGAVAILEDGRRINIGSGSDIELKHNITARFDVAKTRFGWYSGNGKYAESGIASWTGLGGIPILKTHEAEVARIEANWNKNTPGQREIYLERLRPIYEESKAELIKDFGQEFVFGKRNQST